MANDTITITPTDLLRLQYCSFGTRLWFKRIGLNCEKFLREGLTAAEVIAVTDDAMALELIEKVTALKQGGG